MTPEFKKLLTDLSEMTRMLDKATNEIAVLDEKAVTAKCEFEKKFAHAFLSAEGPMDARKQIAVLASAEQKLTQEIAEAKHRACRERIRTLGVQIDVARTMSAAYRQQFASEAVGQWT